MKLITKRDPDTGFDHVLGVTIPQRKKDSHKYDYGCDLIIGGSVSYTGAPVYSAEAASRAGAGLVFLGVPEKIYEIETVKADSAIPFPLECEASGMLSAAAFFEVSRRFPKSDVCLIGPGMGRSESTAALTHKIVEHYDKQLILDADGINALIGHIDVLGLSERPMILTPHMGEFSRIGGDTSASPPDAARDYAVKHNCIMVLKGHETVTAFPDGDVYINTTGGPGLSKGGSGDILAGIILSFVGQGFPLKSAVPAAVFIHGLAGDICEKELGEYSVLPSDVIRAIPKAILQLMG